MSQTASIPEFGTKRENEERRDGGCAVVFDPVRQRYAVNRVADREAYWLFSGGVENGEDIKEGVLREVVEESGLHNFDYVEKIAEALTHYHNPFKKVNRVAHATCFLVILKDCHLYKTHFEEHEKFTLFWASAEEIMNNLIRNSENSDLDHWVYFFKKCVNRARQLGYDRTSERI